MNIKLITYSRTKNYGGILQAYGLYRYLQLQNHEVSFIDYIPRRCNIENKKVFIDDLTSQSRIWGMNAVTKWLFSVLKYPALQKCYAPFRAFLDSKAAFTKAYYSEQELEQEIPQADVYLTGSDQVWNSQFTRGNKLDFPFYLTFVREGKRIAYASSFGRDFIPEDHKETVKKYLSQYQAVSVREPSGQKILEELGISAAVTVDPTILCPVEEWKNISSHPLAQDYILVYMVSFHKDLFETARKVAERMQKKLICISLDPQDRWRVARSIRNSVIVAPSIEDWLSYIQYADGVITDSFHASVFSILFQRPFIVNSGTRKGMSSRITNLLSALGMEIQNVKDFDPELETEIMTTPIDWEVCHKRIQILRTESENWLKQALGDS